MTLDATDLDLLVEIANLRAHVTMRHGPLFARLTRLETTFLNHGLHAAGLPLKPLPSAEPLPVYEQRHPKQFAPGEGEIYK